MKRILIVLFVLVGSIEIYAQKSFILVSATRWSEAKYNIELSGNLPSDMKNYYSHYELTDILNKLSENGYDLEYCIGDGTIKFIFTKGSSNSVNAIQKVRGDDVDVFEIARYNLQGIPVKENEKGIQIIVYSNYTTKTIIVQ